MLKIAPIEPIEATLIWFRQLFKNQLNQMDFYLMIRMTFILKIEINRTENTPTKITFFFYQKNKLTNLQENY
jgi:hypothetical protein